MASDSPASFADFIYENFKPARELNPLSGFRATSTPDDVVDWLKDGYVAGLITLEELELSVTLALQGFVPPQFPGADALDAETWATKVRELAS